MRVGDYGEVAGCRLDIAEVETHTCFMLSCFKGISVRHLALFGLVVLMVCVVGVGWADDDLATSTAFPFLSPRTGQATMLANAFMFQMMLFSGIAGDTSSGATGGGLSAIRYLAMFAIMMGALLILFFPKYQKLPVVVSWLLLAVIAVMLPLGSKLVFYPIKITDVPVMVKFSAMETPVQDGSDCKGHAIGCGFTPQLVAVHIASVMQMITSDIFRSTQWAGLMERQSAATELYTKPDFNLGKPWIDLKKDYGACDNYLKDIIPNSSSGATGSTGASSSSTAPEPLSLRSVWGMMKSSFSDPNREYTVPPPVIVFPLTLQDVDADGIKWDAAKKDAYINGVKALCAEFCTTHQSRAAGITFDGANNSLSVKDALGDMKDTLFKPNIGFFENLSHAFSTMNINVGVGAYVGTTEDVKKQDSDIHVWRRCFIKKVTSNSAFSFMENRSAECASSQSQVTGDMVLPDAMAGTYNRINDAYIAERNDASTELPENWLKFVRLVQGDVVGNMPVLYGNPVPKEANTSGTQTGANQYPVPEITAIAGPSCITKGKMVVNMSIDSLINNQPEPKTFANLVKMLRGEDTEAISKLPETPLIWSNLSALNISELRADPEKEALVRNMTTRMNEAVRRVNMERVTNKELDLRVAMINSLIALQQRVTLQTAGLTDNGVLQNAATDGISLNPKLIGFKFDSLSAQPVANAAAAAAYGFGRVAAAIGAFFTGPLALTYIKFLTVLVDFALMAMIVITPFLFLFGLVIPTAAAGVLTISVLSVFILKFVPVTLIIMNGLGGMVYDLLPGSVGIDADFNRDLMVIAMGGLYTNLVGLTFFLMFKIGDPAAFLGRLTALDGAAKELADTGMTAVKAVVAAATTLATGGVMAGLGYGSLKGAARAAAGKIGAGGAFDAVDGVMKQPTAADDALKPGDPGYVDEKELDAQKAREEAFDADPNALGLREQMTAAGFTDEEKAAFRSNGFVEKNGKLYKNDNGFLMSTGIDGLSGATAQQRMQEAESRGQWDVSSDSFVASDIGTKGLQTSEQALGVQNSMNQARIQAAESAGAAATTAAATAEAAAVAGAAAGATTAGGAGTLAQGAGPIQVSVVDGKLSNVGEVGNIQGLSGVQAKAADLQDQELASRVASRNAELEAAKRGASADDVAKITAMQKAYSSVNNAADLAAVEASAENRALNPLVAGAKTRENYARNLEDQRANEIARVESEMASGKASPSRMKDLQTYKSQLEKINPTGLTQAELQARSGTMEEMKRAMALRGAADTQPGLGQTVWSGVYGAWSGSKSALGKIPVIGPAIAEATNEFYQAPERARAWNAVGGQGNFSRLQANAQRLSFYNKEMAPIAAGQQYESMMRVGAFQVQADMARQTANESVAKSRSQYEAMVASSQAIRGGSPKDAGFRNYMTVDELTGIGRVEAADRIASVRQEAYLMQGQSLTVQRAVQVDASGAVMKDAKGNMISAMDDNMQIKLDSSGNMVKFKVAEVDTVLTAQSLHKIRGDMATKKHASSYDDMMAAHYGLVEKQYQRGNNDWDSTRNMTTSGAAARMFARKDVSTDYMIGGHLKMVEGKNKFKDLNAQYEKLIEFRGDENKIKAAFIQEAIKSNGSGMSGVLQAAAAAGKYDLSKEAGLVGAQIQTYRREALDKYATDVLKKSNVLLKMEAIFDESAAKGDTKYEELALIAPARKATRDAKLAESIVKEYSKMFDGAGWGDEAYKSSTIRRGGVSEKQDDLIKTLTTKLAGTVRHEDLGRVVNGLVDAFSAAPNSQKIFTNTVNASVEGKPAKDMVISAVGVDENGFKNAENTFKNEPAIWTAIKGLFKPDTDSDNKTYYRVGSTAIENDGTKHFDKDIKINKVIKE